MKKSEMIRRKNKLKTVNSYRYMKFAQGACVLIIVLFLFYVAALAGVQKSSYEELFANQPLVIIGFVICTANLYVWWVLKQFCHDIAEMAHIESIRIHLIVLTVFQFVLLNFVSVMLMVLSLVKYFRWDTFSWRGSLKEMTADGQRPVLITTLTVMVIFTALVYMIFFAVRG